MKWPIGCSCHGVPQLYHSPHTEDDIREITDSRVGKKEAGDVDNLTLDGEERW